MTDLHKITIAEARTKLRKKEITSVELTESCISAVEESKALNAYCVKTPELAREQAKKADKLLETIGMKLTKVPVTPTIFELWTKQQSRINKNILVA
jgi:Asp-tRNA(Asn)/Glu-tRNA(Gln) amidotransferase A subunit family amidase